MPLFLDVMSTALENILHAITSALSGLLATIVHPFSLTFDAITSFFSSIGSSISHFFHAIAASILHFFHAIAASILHVFHAVITFFTNIGTTFTLTIISITHAIGSGVYYVAITLVVVVLIVTALISLASMLLAISPLLQLFTQCLRLLGRATILQLRLRRKSRVTLPEAEHLLPHQRERTYRPYAYAPSHASYGTQHHSSPGPETTQTAARSTSRCWYEGYQSTARTRTRTPSPPPPYSAHEV